MSTARSQGKFSKINFGYSEEAFQLVKIFLMNLKNPHLLKVILKLLKWLLDLGNDSLEDFKRTTTSRVTPPPLRLLDASATQTNKKDIVIAASTSS